MTTFFTDAKLACRCGCGLLRFHPGFLDELDALRREFDAPMVVTSACRCKAHNDRPAKDGGAGGNVRSLHVGDFEQHPGMQGTLAVDIATPDGGFRLRLFALAAQRGWSIGWNGPKKFLHLDRRVDLRLPQLVQTSFDY